MSTLELSDAELWILLTLDDATSLGELLVPIRVYEQRPSRRPWRKLEAREIRPALELGDAVEALTSLVTRDLVEIREVDERRDRPSEPRVATTRDAGSEETFAAIVADAQPHPFDTGRSLSIDEAHEAIRDPSNWGYPADTGRDLTYWTAITEAGESAYEVAREKRGPRQG